MKCKLENREELISRYLLNELSDEESIRFEEHYFICEECFKQLKAAEEAFALIKLEGKSLKESAERKSIFDKIFGSSSNSFKWAVGFASIIILLIIGYALFNTGSENVKEKTIVNDKDSLKNLVTEELKKDEKEIVVNKNQKNLIAELSDPSFKPNPYYEEWINDNVRSINNIVEKILSPALGDTIKTSTVNFNFRSKESVPVRLVVLDNSENEIESLQLNRTDNLDYQFRLKTSALKSGLYYWKIEDEREVLFVGKFYFVKRQ